MKPDPPVTRIVLIASSLLKLPRCVPARFYSACDARTLAQGQGLTQQIVDEESKPLHPVRGAPMMVDLAGKSANSFSP